MSSGGLGEHVWRLAEVESGLRDERATRHAADDKLDTEKADKAQVNRIEDKVDRIEDKLDGFSKVLIGFAFSAIFGGLSFIIAVLIYVGHG